MIRKFMLGAACAFVWLSVASAHVTLETPQAPVGSSYKGVLRVPHGCEGTATTAIRVRVPDGVIAVKPMPKPGWTLVTATGQYQRSYTVRGAKVSEGVTEMFWSGGKLLDAHYDEFIFTGVIAEELEAGKTIYFPVVQECEKGVHRWIEIPAGHGEHGHAGPEPAPSLRLLPKR